MGITQGPGASAATQVPPVASGGDSGPALTAALAQGSVSLVPGATYSIATQVSWPAGRPGTYLYMQGASVTSTVPLGSGTTAVFSALPVAVGSVLALNADTTVGATTISLVTAANVAVDAWVSLSNAVLQFGQFFQVKAISGSGPFTVTLDREVGFVFTVAATAVYVQIPAIGCGIIGGGAVITATTTQDRGIEWQVIDSVVEDVTLRGAFQSLGISFDIGSLRCRMRGVRVFGNGVVTKVGAAGESNEQCSFTDCHVSGIISGATRACFILSNGIGNVYTNLRASSSLGYGFALDYDLGAGGEPGSNGSTMTGCFAEHCNVGCIVTNAAHNWTIVGLTCSWCTADGVQFATISSGVPTGNRLYGLTLDHNGNDGILLAAGSDNLNDGARITSSVLHGIEITAATGTVIRGGSIGGCGTSGTGYGAKASASCLIDGVHFADSITGAINPGSAATVTIRGCTFACTLGTAWNGVFVSGTGVVRISDCDWTMTGVGTLACVQTSGGTTMLRGCRGTGPGTSYGVYVNSGKVYIDNQSCDFTGTGTPLTGSVTYPTMTFDVGPLSSGTAPTAARYVLAGAKVAGVWTKTAGGTQVGTPVVTFATNSITVVGGTLDTSTYTVAVSGAR